MTSQAIETQGTKLYISPAGSPPDWTQVKELVSFTAFDGQAQEIDVTNLDSEAKEFLMGLQDWGGFNGEFNYVDTDAGQSAMLTAKGDRGIRNFKLEMSNGKYYEFAGFVLNSPISGGVDAKVDRSFQIRISGNLAGPFG
jgi:hypothetical protein